MPDFTFDALEPLPGTGAATAVASDSIGIAIAEAEAIREAARVEGWEAGRLEAMTQARLELEPTARALAEAVAQFEATQRERADALERQAIDLALQIAEKVLAGALQARPELVLEVVAGALRTLVERERVTVAVHPDDATLVREGVDAIAGAMGGIANIDVQADRRVTRGGAVVRTADGEVDGTVEAKLERAREAILRELRG